MASSTTRQKYWYTHKNQIAIIEKSDNITTQESAETQYTSISVTGKTVRIFGVFKPTALGTELTTASDTGLTSIPSQFHEVIVNKVIANGYKDPRNLKIDLATYFDSEYDKGLREAKKFSKSRYKRGGVIKPHDF